MRRNPNLAEPIGVADQLVDIAPEKKKTLHRKRRLLKPADRSLVPPVRLGSCIAALTIALPILSVLQAEERGS